MKYLNSQSAAVLFFLSLCSPAFAAEPVEFSVGDFLFQRPSEWAWVQPSSAMRKAELRVEGPEGDAEITFFHFGSGQGGTPEANISRWLGQFQEPLEQLDAKTAQQQSGKTKVSFVQARGTFLSGMPGGPTEPRQNFALRGAILESPEKGDVYVKMTGPATTVDAAGEVFDALVLAAAASR